MAAGSVLAPSAAPAEFRYVAPLVVEMQGPELPPLPPGAPAESDGDGAGWRVGAGESLRSVLERWGARAGVEVLFLTDRRYRLQGGRTFAGGFADAVAALFAALSHLPHPPVADPVPGGGSISVTHRTAHSAPSQGDMP